MTKIDQAYFPNPVQPLGKADSGRQISRPVTDSPFSKVLDNANSVRFSQHAQDRLNARNIIFSKEDIQRLEGAVNSVAQKGGRDSLVMLGDAALVVSVQNRTVVTAMDRSQMKGNIFTNIDSAVVI